MVTTHRKKTRKKGKPLRQSWRDLVSWWTRAKVAKAKRARQAVTDTKKRDDATKALAAAKAEKERLKAEARAKRDAARAAAKAAEQQAAARRAEQRAAGRVPGDVTRFIIPGHSVPQAGSVLCGQPHITDPRQKCGHPVLPGTHACAAGHPQGASSFGGGPARAAGRP